MRALIAVCALALSWIAQAPPAHAIGCILLGCDCNVTVSDMNFPDFNPLLGGQHTAVANVQVSCTGIVSIGAGVVVELDDGQWGTYSARRMRSDTGQLLDYNLYTNSGHGTVWGNGTLGSVTQTLSGGFITLGTWSRSRDIFGRITVNPMQTPGDYEDTVVVRIIW